MRFKEFTTESTVPATLSAKPKPGYKGFKVAGKIVWAPATMSIPEITNAINADPSILKQAQQDLTQTATTTAVPPNLQSTMPKAKAIADSYLGRPLVNYEWDALLRVTNAEAGHNPDEQAWVMGAVLNSVRRNNNTVYHEISKPNRMQSVTGSATDASPSPNFSKALPPDGLSEILTAAKKLPAVPKNVIHFTAADETLYSSSKGTNKGWLTKLLTLLKGTQARVNPPNVFAKKVGQSIFATDFTPEDLNKIQLALASKPVTKTITTQAKPALGKRA